MELGVTAGTDVAFALALLRCSTPDEDLDARLRLTFGLRKVYGPEDIIVMLAQELT